MKENAVGEIVKEALDEIKAADAESLEKVRFKFLGKSGTLTQVLRSLSSYSIDEKKTIGAEANAAKTLIDGEIEKRKQEINKTAIDEKINKEKIDISPSFYFPFPKGHFHPIMKTISEVSAIFVSLGFSVESGPEIETDWYNFEALNHPPDHPARDIQDTFYLEGMKNLLRTHTSPGQIHVMENQVPPIKIIVPGRVYRNEASDASHSSTFHQVEGLFVDENVTFVDLKNTLTSYVKRFFGQNSAVRFRPSFFPFTEPSAEMDVQCFFCGGKGCGVCKQSGWIEILGCGMVHPNVFKSVKYDSEKYTGFAFGIGIERIAMIKYGIGDIRLFYENDLRFLEQF
ncbi:MAG: phenylalanine--tRNA ligase subunit alpha [Elusimicrobiota bacterium]|jgi:phenylalanyl-tRNA synthetase alpha chain|nr:phenylalanine--tRNA ligase subunit alpha [Elusimicrobiota bacterium]